MKLKTIIITFVVVCLLSLITTILYWFFIKDTQNPIITSSKTQIIPPTWPTGEIWSREEPEVLKPNPSDTYNILPSIDDEITEDSMWCGTFQLVWNDMVNNFVKQDVVFDPQLQVVENLNKQTFSNKYLSENSYFSIFGLLTLDLKAAIENWIKEKFNETSDILNQIDWSGVPQSDDAYKGGEKKYAFYAMLKKIFNFEYAFDEIGDTTFDDKYNNIKFFWIHGDSNEKLYKQVEVYYYNSKDDFAVALKTKEWEEIILARWARWKSFLDIYNNILAKKSQYKWKSYFTENDYLRIPNLKVKTLTEFEDLEYKLFFNADGHPCNIEKALQTIEFELNKSWWYIKSEALIVANDFWAAVPEYIEHRYFYFDKPFVMFWKEADKDLPYFATQISNITLFQE